MAYEQGARNSPSQPDNLLDPTRKNLNPWQDKSTNNYLSGYHGNAVYQQPPISPELDPVLQETDDGWSEWPADWDVEDSDQCMSNGFSNGFNNQSSYSQQQQQQLTTSHHQPQNFGHFFDQVPPPNQQQITQPQVESTPPNSFFNNVQLNNSSGSTAGNTAHLFPQESMAATVRTGISYAAVLSGNAEAPEQNSNNGEFDDINLNDNTDAGFSEEAPFTQPEPALPAASFSPFPTPIHEKMERSAAHLFSKPAVSGTSHNDLFGSAAEASLENDNDFGDKRTFFDQEQQQRDDVGHSNVQESFGINHPTSATEEQRLPEIPSKESEEQVANAFEVHRPPPNEIGHPNIEDAFASSETFVYPTQQKQPELADQQAEEAIDNAFEANREPSNEIEDSFASSQPFTYPTQKQYQPELAVQQAEEALNEPSNESVPQSIEDSFASNQPIAFPTRQTQPEMPLQKAEEATNDAFEAHREPSNESVPQSIEDSFASNQPIAYPQQTQPEMPLQKAEEATNDAFEAHREPSNESVPQSIEDSFASNQPFAYPTQQTQPEMPLQQVEETDDNTLGVHSIPSEESFHPDVEDSFASHQPFSFSNQGPRQPEMAVQESEEAGSIHEDLHPERSQESFFAPETPFRSADIDEGTLGQTVEQPNQVVPDVEGPFAVDQPALAVDDHSQQPESGGGIQEHFGVESFSHNEHSEPTVPEDPLNQMALQQGEPMSVPVEQLQDDQQGHMASMDPTPPWQPIVAAQETSFSQSSEMVTGEEPSIPMQEVSPETSESESSASSHDTSSNSNQSQIEAAAWREEEATSYDKYSQPPPPNYVPQPSTMGQMEDDVPKGEFYEHEQSTPSANVLPPPSMMSGKTTQGGPREIAHKHVQPSMPPTSTRQPSKVDGSVPGNDFFQHEQHVPPTDAIQPPPMAVGKIESDVPKSSSHEFFQPGPPPTSMAPSLPVGKMQEDVPMTSTPTFFQPGPPPTNMARPPLMSVDKNVSKTGVQGYFQPGLPPTKMVQQPPGGKMQEDVPKSSAKTIFQPGPPTTNVVQPPPPGGKMQEDVPKPSAQTFFQPGPPTTNVVQPPPPGGKMQEDVPKPSAQTFFQPGPPSTNVVQPPPPGGKMQEDVPKPSAQTFFQPGPPSTNVVQPPPPGGKMQEDVPKPSAQTFFQPGPPTTNVVQPPPPGGKMQEDVPKPSAQAFFQPGPPPTNVVKPPPPGGKMQEDVPKPSAQTFFQPGPSPTNMVQPPPMSVAKDVPKTDVQGYFQTGPPPTKMVQTPMTDGQEDVAKTGAKAYFQPGPPPTNMVQPTPITGSKIKESAPKVGAHNYFQPGPPPSHMVQPSHGAANKMEDVPKRGGHEYFHPGPPPTSIGQQRPTTAGKMTNVAQNQSPMQEQSAPPTGTMPPPSMVVGKKEEHNQSPPANMVPHSVVDDLKKPLHEHGQPAPPASTVQPVPMFPKAAQMEQSGRPAKTSTPEPLMPPESGPMAMTKRPTRGEKSKTPVSLSSSLWSTDVPTAMASAIMLAAALQPSPKPAVPSPVTSEALQPKQELSDQQPLPSEQDLETKGDSLASLSKKERKAEKKRLKALKKEQKKLKKECKTPVEGPATSSTIPFSSTPEKVEASLHNHPTNPLTDSSLHNLSTENPVGNPHGVHESGHHAAERQHDDKYRRGDEFGVQPKEVGNPYVGDHGTYKESIHYPSRGSEYYGKNVGIDEHGIDNPHRREYRPHYDEYVEEKRHSRHGNVDDDYYSNPRVRDLREESPSRASHRRSEHLPHQDYTHRNDDRDSYHDQYSASDVPRTSYEDLDDRSFRRHAHYDDRHNLSGDRHDLRYGSDYDDRYDRDYRYTRNRTDAEGYRSHDYDHYKRGQTRADDYDYYSSRRSREEHSYLDRSFDSQYDRGRPERSSREELDSYRNDYHRDSADRGIFKPINDPYYGEYKESYRSNTPSSGSGRSTPAGYDNRHDPYYGYQHPQHPYPGYEHPYGYYPGRYGMPYHYPPPGYYPGYGPYFDYYHQYGGFGSGHGSQYSSGEGSYPDNQVNEGQPAEESALEKDQEEGEVQEVAPLRTTPLHFLRPHMTCRFGPAGQLLVTLPHHPDDGQKPLVQVSTLKAIFSVKEQEQIEAFPGPLTCRGTMKRQVIEYVQTKADEIQQSSTDLASQQARWVLWKFLLSLIKHNGAIVAEDIAEMLMLSVQHFEKKKKKRPKKKRHQSEESSSNSDSSSDDDSSDDSSSDSSDDEASSVEDSAPKPPDHLLVFRGLLLEGNTKEALEYAMSNSLWTHAVLLGGLMDTKVNNSLLDSKNSSSIISRFFMTLEEKDPLKTVYEHLGGKVPQALKHHTNWASNLAGIIANPTSFPEKDKENIITLGDTLAKHPDLLMASHLCYLLAGLRPGTPGTNCKMVLIGCQHRSKKCDKFESLEALQLTELFEYASSLENPEFFLPSLQMFRYFFATKLVDAGYHKEALAYLQCVGDLMMKHPHSFNDTMKKNMYRTTEQLVGYMEGAGISVELFILSWLKRFNNVMEGKDSGISLPQQESETEDDEDPMAQSSMSYFSGYEHPPAQEEQSSPESTPYTHNTVSRQASLQSTHSVPSVHSLQTLDMSQPVPTEIYQPNEPIEHKESFSSQGYQDQNDGPEFQTRQPTESVDPWQQQQQQFGNDMWMPGGLQQNNSWMTPASAEEIGRGTSPEDGETTPVNSFQTFDDFYHQANPMTGRGSNWEDESAKTPTLSPSESSLPGKDTTESIGKEEKTNTKAAEKNKQAQSSGFWNGITGLVKTLIPTGPKEVHLPDDKNKTIYFDKELNKWINTEESEEDRAPPPPPPTDAMIGGMSGPPSLGPRPGGNPGIPGPGSNPLVGAPQSMMPPNPTMPTPGTINTQAESVPDNSRAGPGSPGGPGSTGNNQQSLPEILPGMQTPGKPAGPPSKFSRKAQGRLGSRNKYVDVLNPNKGPPSSSQAVPSALFPVMPSGGSTFQGTLFVPSAAPAANDADNSSSQPPTDIQSGPENPQPPSPTHSRSSSLGSQSTVSLASAEVRSYFEGQEHEGEQLQNAPPQQPTFFDPSNFQPQPQSHSMARRGRGRYPGGYNK